MNDIIETYVKKILESGCNIQKGDDVFIYSTMKCDSLIDTVCKLKDDYKINEIIPIIQDYEDLYHFFESDPSDTEIEKYAFKIPKIKDLKKTKVIYVLKESDLTYYKKLCDEYLEKFWVYYNEDMRLNHDFFDADNDMFCTCIIWPNKRWAKSLLGDESELIRLFELVNSVTPNEDVLNTEIEKLKEIKEFLNKTDITNLHFYTNVGTDFNIKLTKNSLWSSSFKTLYNQEHFYNFPSYELFTAPNCYSAEGEVVITKPSVLCGEKIEQAKLYFKKGKLVAADNTENRNWRRLVAQLPNTTRIGEIALVSNNSPVAKANQIFDSLLFDENAGCHLALGTAFPECINIPIETLNEKGFKYYKFNYSDYHQDLVFGDESIFVEAKTRSRKRIILMEDGKWKI